jgi:hypothetical protein
MTTKKHDVLADFITFYGKCPDNRSIREVIEAIHQKSSELERLKYQKEQIDAWETAYNAFTHGVALGRQYEREDNKK